MVQGGDFHIKMGRVINTLHPLNLVTPLGDITNLQIKGLIYLAPLNPDMEIFISGRRFCVPVKCHHASDGECGCDYAANLSSRNVPVKIYYDLNLTSDRVHSTYGDILMSSIPRLLNIIQCLIPKPPFVDSRHVPATDKSPSLEWWDNMRFQFHGQFRWKIENMSFRWLLDTVPRYDSSILLTSKNFLLSHSTGTAALDMDSVVISIPDSSYHMLEARPINNGHRTLQQYLENNEPGFRRMRHPLILFPKFRTQFHFKWEVSETQRNHSSRHHNVYMVDELVIPASPNDKFEHFRSRGWDIVLDVQLEETPKYGTWIALRGDVLPWLTHKSPRFAPATPPSGDESDPLPQLNGIQINVDVSTLNISAWFDEKLDNRVNDGLDGILEGIFLQIPKLKYSLSKKSGNAIDLYGTIQAALLDIVRDYDDSPSSTNPENADFPNLME